MAAIDWRLFARLAAGHGLVGVLYGRLERLPQALAAPPAALAELRRFYLAQASLDLRRKHWLTEVLEALHARSLAVIALKGAYLAEAVYADSLDRPMVDIDLLVQLADLPGVAQALTDLGYQASKDFWLDVELGVEHQLPSFMKSGATPVEVHWRLLDPDLPFPVDLPALWQRALPAQVAGQPVRCLCPEDLLLHLCLHAATQHRFRDGLRNVYDVAATLVHFRDTLDWEALLQRAQEWQAGRALFLMFWLALELFAAPLPDGLLQTLQPPSWLSACSSPGRMSSSLSRSVWRKWRKQTAPGSACGWSGGSSSSRLRKSPAATRFVPIRGKSSSITLCVGATCFVIARLSPGVCCAATRTR
jgi:hypothetical protein